MPTPSTRELLEQLQAHEASPVIDHDTVEALLAQLQQRDEDELLAATGLDPSAPELSHAHPPMEPHAELLSRAGRLDVWRNWPRNLESRELDLEAPGSAASLLAAMQQAVDAGKRIKPLGAGFSCSEASQPDDGALALNTQARINRLLPIDHVRSGVATTHLVRVEAGIRLIDLATQLAARQLALPNMGGFAKQTLAGVLSTATHGTGLSFSSFSDIVVSVDIACVDEHGRVAMHRFEPRGGITDPNTYPDAATLLHQDDELFHSVVVAGGMIGIVYSYTIAVIDLYFVRETHERFVFPDDFAAAYARAQAKHNISITLHPYATLPGGKHLGIITHFERLDKAQVDAINPNLWKNPPDRPPDREFFGAIAKVFGTTLIGWFMSRMPRIVLRQVEKWLEKQPSEQFLSVYYKTYPRTTGDRFRAIYSESSVPIEQLEHAVGLAFAHAAAAAAAKDYHYLVPFALRFIKASQHLISMHYGRDSATIEAFVMRGVPKAEQALRELEHALPMGRPHWGQMHWFCVPVEQQYPESWSRWLAHYRRFNATGIFDSPITARLNISSKP